MNKEYNTMKRDIGDLIDRWSIAKLKSERIGEEENKKEYSSFNIALKDVEEKNLEFYWNEFKDLLYAINSCIWTNEAGLKGGKEELVDKHYIYSDKNREALAKIGQATIIIRDFNMLRVRVKNLINTILKDGFQDIKKDHLSEK